MFPSFGLSVCCLVLAHVHARMSCAHTCHRYVHACLCACTRTWICVSARVLCVHTCAYMCSQCTCMCIHVCSRVCAHVHICKRVCTHTVDMTEHAHTHIRDDEEPASRPGWSSLHTHTHS